MDLVTLQGLHMPVDQLSHTSLQMLINGGALPGAGLREPHPAGQMRRQRWHRHSCPGERLPYGQLAGKSVDMPSLHQRQQQPVPLLPEFFRVTTRVYQRGSVGQHRQRGGLGPGEVGCATTGIAPGGSLNANSVASEGRVGGIELQDSPLGAEELQLEGRKHLYDLAAIGTLGVTAGHPCHLHGDGAAAADNLPRPEVVCQRPDHGNGIDAGMPPEPAVLVVDEAGDVFVRQAVGRREPPLPVVGHTSAEEGAVSRLHHRGEGCAE